MILDREIRLAGITAYDNGFIGDGADMNLDLASGMTLFAAVYRVFQKVGQDGDEIQIGYWRILLDVRRNRNRNPLMMRLYIKAVQNGVYRNIRAKFPWVRRFQAFVILL